MILLESEINITFWYHKNCILFCLLSVLKIGIKKYPLFYSIIKLPKVLQYKIKEIKDRFFACNLWLCMANRYHFIVRKSVLKTRLILYNEAEFNYFYPIYPDEITTFFFTTITFFKTKNDLSTTPITYRYVCEVNTFSYWTLW